MDGEPLRQCLRICDVEEDPDRWCSYTECGQELWQIACQWVWNLRLSLGYAMQGEELREIEWAPPKARPPLFSASDEIPETYGDWQWAKGGGRGQIGGSAFLMQDDGTPRCPAGATLWFSELRQENAFTQRAVFLAALEDCQRCALREQCLRPGAKGNRARRLSAVRRLLPIPATVEPRTGVLPATRWRDVAGRADRSHLDRPLAQTIRRGAFPGGKSAKGLASASFSPRLAFSPALELGGPTGAQRLAGTTELPRHGCWCPFFSGRELRLASRTVRRGEVHSFKPHLKATIILIFCQREGVCLCDVCEVLFLHRVLVS